MGKGNSSNFKMRNLGTSIELARFVFLRPPFAPGGARQSRDSGRRQESDVGASREARQAVTHGPQRDFAPPITVQRKVTVGL